MRKKPTKKEQRIEQEIAAIESVLRDLALGANGGYAVDDEFSIVGGMDIKGFGGLLKAVSVRFDVGLHLPDDADFSMRHALSFERFEHLENFDTFARHLHECGVRES